MLIKWKDVRVGDEILIPSNSNLKYLKVLSKTPSGKSFKCSTYRGDKPSYWNPNIIIKNVYECEADVLKHNSTFYLRDDRGYSDIWLVKREDYD